MSTVSEELAERKLRGGSQKPPAGFFPSETLQLSYNSDEEAPSEK